MPNGSSFEWTAHGCDVCVTIGAGSVEGKRTTETDQNGDERKSGHRGRLHLRDHLVNWRTVRGNRLPTYNYPLSTEEKSIR